MLASLHANLIAALVFAALGIAVFIAAFALIDKATPYNLWKEIIEEHNTALAVLIGLVSLGVSIIIAAAIH
jgi:putative membrane protein